VAYTAGVSDLSQVQGLVQALVNEPGLLNKMVANAGIAQVKALLDLTEQDLKSMFQVNGKAHTTPLSETLLMLYRYTVYTTATPPQPNK
jgi:NAD(P)-dependent dehydrogenase (short-subunit alcohol dehydrogenase family)